MSYVNKSRYDAVIALANMMDREGNLNSETRARVEVAARAIDDGRAPVLVCCGWAHPDFDTCIADAMKRYAVDRLGVAASAIVAEPAPRDTVGEAVFTKRNLAAPRGWSHVLVVTSRYHLPRALTIFSFVYGPAIRVDGTSADTADSNERQESEAQSIVAFRKTFEGIEPGDDAAIFERLRNHHPFYNGDVYPRLGVHK
jgi:uncharacterized SAM-binding protein YcdF (DUF218 family)